MRIDISLLPALAALAFSLYLTRIEARILGVYCIYCMISLGIISLLTLLVAFLAIRAKGKELGSTLLV